MASNRKTLIVLGVAALLVACAIGVVVIAPSGAPQTSQPPAAPTPTAEPPAPPTPDIQTVRDNNEEVYPFDRLEEVKDFLADYMDQYSILALDANELTNRVDVGLKAYTEENLEHLRALVHDHYPDMDGCLNFEDYSDKVISFTSDQEPATP